MKTALGWLCVAAALGGGIGCGKGAVQVVSGGTGSGGGHGSGGSHGSGGAHASGGAHGSGGHLGSGGSGGSPGSGGAPGCPGGCPDPPGQCIFMGVCQGGACKYQNLGQGSPCFEGICDGQGNCNVHVPCTKPGECSLIFDCCCLKGPVTDGGGGSDGHCDTAAACQMSSGGCL
jgi:hypothetical protein